MGDLPIQSFSGACHTSLRIAIIRKIPRQFLKENPLKRVIGIVVVAGIAIALGLYLYPGALDTGGTQATSKASKSDAATQNRVPASSPGASSAAQPVQSTSAVSQASPSVRVQTTADVFALFNELKNGQFASDKETADARYAAMMALEECAKYAQIGTFKNTIDRLHNLPASDPSKALRLKAYEFDVGRCKGFQGWTIEQISAESQALLAQAAKLGSSAAKLTIASRRFFDEGLRKPEVKDAVMQELQQIPPDGNALVEASNFIAHFRNNYNFVSERSGEKYPLELMTAALYSLACEQGGLCDAKYRGSNTASCWMSGECASLPPDQHLQREALAPAQYERFLVLRQELAANVASGRWPPGFWAGVQHHAVKLGTAVSK
jgi:hypothetical protein